VRQGRLNFTTLADFLEGALVMTGTFSVLNQPTTILFDSDALVLLTPNSVSIVNYLYIIQKGPI
jgi:hypothetical protein